MPYAILDHPMNVDSYLAHADHLAHNSEGQGAHKPEGHSSGWLGICYARSLSRLLEMQWKTTDQAEKHMP